ncbi:MAG: LytTR family DNA-binding domain-containing protein [Bacteroidota bacterium]
MLKAIIIDDLETARENLKADLASYVPEVELLGEAEGVVSGAKLLRQTNPDVVFLDVEMQDGTGFDLLEVLGEVSAKVIFTTAHDAFALKAFRFSAIDYLLKPVDPDELVEAVAKVKKGQGAEPEPLQALAENRKQVSRPSRLALHTMEKIHVVNIEEIIRCESSANYTIFYFSDQKQLLVTKTLKEFDKMLSDQGFLRVHQSHLVNLSYVKEFVKIDGGYLVMRDGSNVPVSSRKKSMVVQTLSEM